MKMLAQNPDGDTITAQEFATYEESISPHRSADSGKADHPWSGVISQRVEKALTKYLPVAGDRALYAAIHADESEPKYFYMDRPRLHGFYYVCPSHHPPLGWWCGTHGNTFAKFANLRKHLRKVC